MGYDAFGLPAENHAIRTGEHPRDSTWASIEEFREQFRRWGISIDWTREFATCEPEYYRWTQWLFLRLLERDLAYRDDAPVHWCPNDQTVLANEQVIDGHCERCGALVEVRHLDQWYFRITEYADRLLADFDLLASWPEHVVTMQRNWIGRSEGAEAVFRCEELELDFPVFTTRPGHALRRHLLRARPRAPRPRAPDRGHLQRRRGPRLRGRGDAQLDRRTRRRGAREDRRPARARGGQPGQRRVDPDVRRRLRADGVRHRGDHGRPGARRARLRVRGEVRPRDPAGGRARRRRSPARGRGVRLPIGRREARQLGRSRRSHPLARPGRGSSQRLEAEGRGKPAVNYRLRDWLLSRQRYWGCPIPVVHCPSCGIVPVPDDQLPVELPDVEDYRPKGQAPLAAADRLGRDDLPLLRRPGPPRDRHDGHVRRLVLVLPPLPRPARRRASLRPRDRRSLDARRPVHRRRRARDPPPDVRALLRQGARGRRLPRRAGALRPALHAGDDHPRRGEDVQVEGQRRQPGGDRRAATAPTPPAPTSASWRRPSSGGDWVDEGAEGVHRFLSRLWRLAHRGRRTRANRASRTETGSAARAGPARELVAKANWAIDKATRDFERDFQFNTVIAAVMELVNEAYRLKDAATRARGRARGALRRDPPPPP